MKKHLSTLLLTVSLLTASGISNAQSVPGYVPTSGLVGWWPFNGNANDESGNGNNGTVNGPVLTADRYGSDSSAYSFFGCNEIHANVNTSSITSAMTLSFWYYRNDTGCIGPRLMEFSQGSTTPGGLIIEENYPTGVKLSEFSSGGTNPVGWLYFSSIFNQTWSHYVYTNDGLVQKTYQDGVLINTYASPGNSVLDGDVAFGRMNHSAFDGVDGKLDDIGIWNRALTQQEITNLYTASTPPPCNPLPGNLMSGLVGYWPFCGNANDESGSGNNGTVNGATLTSDRFGNANSAYEFDGVDDYIITDSIDGASLPSAISISYWLNYDTSNSITWPYRYPVFKGISGSNFDFNSRITPQNRGDFALYDGTTGSFLNSSMPLNSSEWIHVTNTYDGNMVRLYINGVLDTQKVSPFPPLITRTPIYFGNAQNLGFYKGQLDDISIWNRALTPQEISQLYNQNICYQTITVTDTLIINANLTGFNPVTYQNSIKVYPNPTNDHITIDFGANYSTLSGYSVRIDNTLGQTVYTTPIVQQSAYIDLNTWTGNGVYLIYLLNAQGVPVDVRKIVLQ